MTTPEEMGRRIIEYVRRNGDASFANIVDLLGEEAVGEYCCELLPNCALWINASAQLCDAVEWLRTDSTLEIKPTSLLTYMIDGRVPRLPIARRPKRKGYAKLHWLPIIFVMRGKRNK